MNDTFVTICTFKNQNVAHSMINIIVKFIGNLTNRLITLNQEGERMKTIGRFTTKVV